MAEIKAEVTTYYFERTEELEDIIRGMSTTDFYDIKNQILAMDDETGETVKEMANDFGYPFAAAAYAMLANEDYGNETIRTYINTYSL